MAKETTLLKSLENVSENVLKVVENRMLIHDQLLQLQKMYEGEQNEQT